MLKDFSRAINGKNLSNNYTKFQLISIKTGKVREI